MNNVAFVHIINENLGDVSCSPRPHFSEFNGCPELDFRWLPEEMKRPPWTLIVGGGGLLHPGIDDWIAERARAQRVILWGVGLNYHDGNSVPNWREMVKPCALVGLRDLVETKHAGPIFFCPCPSCLFSDFDRLRYVKPVRDVVCFEHYQLPLGFSHPTRSNMRDPRWKFSDAVDFLACGRRVITNSFHGAYWAALLGRPVLVYQPFSTRFRSGLIFKDYARTPEEVREWLDRDTVPAPDTYYLDDSRTINRLMFDRVRIAFENS